MLKNLTKVLTFFKTKYIMALLKKLTKHERRKFILKINVLAVQELINEQFRGNQTWFAEEINVAPAYVSRILNNKVDGNSDKMCNGIIKYCELHNLDFRKYIILV